MDSSSTKDMDSLVISGGTPAAEGSSGLGRPGATQGSRQRRSGGFWLGAPKRQSNDGFFSMQKQTLKRSKSGSKFIHEQFPL